MQRQVLFYDPIIPGSPGGLVQTFKFATLEEYEGWAEGLAPTLSEGTDDCPAMDKDVGAMVDATTEEHTTTSSYIKNVS